MNPGPELGDLELRSGKRPDRFGFDPAREAEWRDLLAALLRAADGPIHSMPWSWGALRRNTIK